MTIEYKETFRFKFMNKVHIAEPGHKVSLPRGKGWGNMGDARTLEVVDKDGIEITFLKDNKPLFSHVYREEDINEVHRNTSLAIEPMSRRDRFLRRKIEYGWRKD